MRRGGVESELGQAAGEERLVSARVLSGEIVRDYYCWLVLVVCYCVMCLQRKLLLLLWSLNLNLLFLLGAATVEKCSCWCC